MIHLRIHGTSKNAHIDNATDTLSTTRMDGQIVILHPLFASNHYYLVSRTDGTSRTENGKHDALEAFLELADAYSETAFETIAERWI